MPRRDTTPAAVSRVLVEAAALDRSVHAVPVGLSASALVGVVDRPAWGERTPPVERVAAIALEGALRMAISTRPMEAVLDRAATEEVVRRRLSEDLRRVGLDLDGLWLGPVDDPTGHLAHWGTVRDAAVGAGARVAVALTDRDAATIEHETVAAAWSAWHRAGLVRELARSEVAAAAAWADQAAPYVAAVAAAAQVRAELDAADARGNTSGSLRALDSRTGCRLAETGSPERVSAPGVSHARAPEG